MRVWVRAVESGAVRTHSKEARGVAAVRHAAEHDDEIGVQDGGGGVVAVCDGVGLVDHLSELVVELQVGARGNAAGYRLGEQAAAAKRLGVVGVGRVIRLGRRGAIAIGQLLAAILEARRVHQTTERRLPATRQHTVGQAHG